MTQAAFSFSVKKKKNLFFLNNNILLLVLVNILCNFSGNALGL